MNERGGDPGDRRLVFRGLSWNVIGYPLNVGLLFAGHVLAANLLTQRGFGTYSLAFSLFTTTALIVQLGLPHSLLRRASTALGRGDEHEAAHEIVSALFFGALVGFVVGAVFASPAGSELLAFMFPATGVASVSLLVGVRSGFKVIENIVPEALRAFRDFLRVVVFDGLLVNLLFAGVLLALVVTSGKSSVRELMLIGVLVAAVALLPALASVFVKIRETRRIGLDLRNPLEPSMWAVTVGRTLLAQLDLLIVGVVASSRDVALYAAPFRLGLLVGLPLIAVNQVVPPLVAGWFAKRQLGRIERLMRGTAGMAIVASLLLALAYVALGREVLGTLFGAEYRGAWTILLILSAGQVAQTMTGSCGFALMMTGHSRWYAWILGGSVIMTLGADLLFYDLFGLEGIAIATAATLTIQNIVQAVAVRRLAGFSVWADPGAALGEARSALKRFGKA